MSQGRRIRRVFGRIATWGCVLAAGGCAALFVIFPGQRLDLAFTLATGLGRDALQARIDAVESKAIRRQPLSEQDRALLVDFYSTLASGAKLTVVIGQTGRLMKHYLDRSGRDLELDPEIFTDNDKVRRQAERLRDRVPNPPCREGQRLTSPDFHMPDASKLDSVFGLYRGRLILTPRVDAAGRCVHHFRAEVPWVWPSYESLQKKYGDPHAESFPLPSALSLLRGPSHALFVDNGLGHHLEREGLAKSFLAFAEWSEVAP